MIPKVETGFRKRSCSNKKLERAFDSIKSLRALVIDKPNRYGSNATSKPVAVIGSDGCKSGVDASIATGFKALALTGKGAEKDPSL